MSPKDLDGEVDADFARSGDGTGDSPLLGRKSVLMGLLATGFVVANAAHPSSAEAAGTVKPIAATQPANVPKWTPSTAYVRGQQVISPNNDVVSAKFANTSSTTYITDTANWTLSPTYGRLAVLPLNVKARGAVGDGLTDDTAAIQGALDAARTPANTGIVFLPGGTYRITASLVIPQGVLLQGSGAHSTGSQPGSTIDASGLASGSGVITTDFWHHGGMERFRVTGAPLHGIHIQAGMGETAYLDRVASYVNGGDGIRVEGASTPLHLGWLSTHCNGGSGLHLEQQFQTHAQILYLAGDNNGAALMTVNGLDTTGSVHLIGWKSERWLNGTPGNPNVFVITNGNGGYVDLGQGRIHVGRGVAKANAVVRQGVTTGTVGRVKIRYSLLDYSGTGGYAYGYEDVPNAKTLTVASTERRTLSIREPLSFYDGTNDGFVELAGLASGAAIFAGSINPDLVIPAAPGSIYMRSTGTVYKKASGTGADGWAALGSPLAHASTELKSATNVCNTTNKSIGTEVFDITLGKPVWASGTTPTAAWKDATGATVHTPA